MIAPADVSRQVEQERQRDPYHLTSRVVMMGSLMSLGGHLYLDRQSPVWREALRYLLQRMNEVKKSGGASGVILRDFDTEDAELRDALATEGFVRTDMFNDHVLHQPRWQSEAQYLAQVSGKSRVHLRKHVLPNQPLFAVHIRKGFSEVGVDETYRLYKQVKDRGFDMNTFDLPKKFFTLLSKYTAWEVIELSLVDSATVVGFGICYRSPSGNYIPMVVGLDYESNARYSTYRQILYQAVKRAGQLQSKNLFFGFGADIEKQKFGTVPVAKSAYLQVDDNYSMESLGKYQQINYAK